MNYMKKESCRACGIEMSPHTKCEICKDFISLHCPKCGKSTDPQIHTHSS